MDVTDEVIASRGHYELLDGDTVDFRQLADAISHWYRTLPEDNKRRSLTLLLISGGITIEVNCNWIRDSTDDEFKLSQPESQDSEYDVSFTMDLELRGSIDYIEVDAFGLLPSVLSNECALIKGYYGTSNLTAIGIEYSDSVEEHIKML